MANKIILKKTFDEGKAPSLESLEVGELASNLNDGDIFIKGQDKIFKFENTKKQKNKILAEIIALG